MNLDLLHEMLDVCFLAKKITELMPPLPQGIKPRHIHILELVSIAKENKTPIRVVDISRQLNVTMPSITKLIQEMEAKDILLKLEDASDKRSYFLELTSLGETYCTIYIKNYHTQLIALLSELDQSDCKSSIATIQQMYTLMSTHPITYEDISK